jgi:hypothetical protein
MKNPPFNRVLCKRESTSGKTFWWDESGEVSPPDHPKRHECEHRTFIKGNWYEITKWKDNSFWIIDSQGNSHAHRVYSDEDRANFPSHCDVHGPCDYSKWFYTPEELKEVEAGTYKQSFKEKHAISVLLGNYHWVKNTEENGGEWIIAQAISHRVISGGNCWKVIGVESQKTDNDFAEIGHQVDSMETQQDNKETIKDHEELNDTIFPLLDSLKHEGTEEEKWHAPVEYHKPFIREAVKKYFDKSFGRLSDSPFFGGSKK